MGEDDPADPGQRELFRRIAETLGEGDLADRNTLSLSEAYRLQQKLALSVVNEKEPYTFAYSISDIEKLQELSREDYVRVRKVWYDCHFGTAFTFWQISLWIAAAVVSWYLT